jgi:hypothetical protein
MFHRDDFPSPGKPVGAQANLRRHLASLKLVEPLMLAALHRPGLGESVPTEEIVEAQTKLIFRTINLTDRILSRLDGHSDKKPFDRYSIAREIVGLVAAQWRAGSELTAQDLTILAEQAVSSGMQLLKDLNEQPYKAGDDQIERLSSAISSSAKIMISMRSRATLGHDLIDLCRGMTEHLAKVVTIESERLKARESAPAIKALIRVFSDYYPVIWDEEINSAVSLFKELKADPEEFKKAAEKLRVWPLEGFYKRVEGAIEGCMGMAITMQQLLEEPVAQPENPQP